MSSHKNAGYHILRVGMAVTFLWIGLLIFREPEFWSGFFPVWLYNAFDDPLILTYVVGSVDLIIGLMLLLDVLTFWIGLIAAGHLLGILLMSGIDSTTVRDIGLLGGSLALAVQNVPPGIRKKFKH